MSASQKFYKYGNQMFNYAPVPLHKKEWSIEWTEYKPTPVKIEFGSKPWADPNINDPNFTPKWNQLDGNVNRQSYCGIYSVNEHGYPLNPKGRTGVCLRGLLGRWGPNHAADPIVTRWKRDTKNEKIINSTTQKPILQFVAILRSDVKEWAIPGGMVDPGEQVSATLKREFCEESLNILNSTVSEQKEINENLKIFFEQGQQIFKGYVDDPRNTDNAWIETIAVNFHDDQGYILNKISLNAGDDAQSVKWIDIDHNVKLYANHSKFIEKTVKTRCGHW